MLPDRVKLERTLCVQSGEYEERLDRAALEEKMAVRNVEGIWTQLSDTAEALTSAPDEGASHAADSKRLLRSRTHKPVQKQVDCKCRKTVERRSVRTRRLQRLLRSIRHLRVEPGIARFASSP